MPRLHGKVALLGSARFREEQMAKHKIALIPGDGIGKEVLPEGVRVLEAAARRFNFELEFTDFDWSCDRLVKTGKTLNGGTEILSGLDEGEQLVVSEVTKLADGQPVTVQP